MTLTAIFRASDRAEFGPHVHLLDGSGPLTPTGDTVVRTLCGRVGIAPVVERDGATCAMCLALSGQHPGGHGKRYLTRWHRGQYPMRRPTEAAAR